MIAARDALDKVIDADLLADCLANDTASNYRTVRAMVAECRELLAEIEAEALERVKMELR